MKRNRIVAFSAAAALVLATGIVFAMGILSLPLDPVTVSHGGWNQGDDSTINIELSGVPDGYDVMNGAYPGWCVEDNFQPDYSGPGVLLLDSTDSEELICGENGYPGYPWDKINYLLNNKDGSIESIQVALWLLTGTYSGTFTITSEALAMVDDANANGDGFLPDDGQVAAVVLCVDGDSGRGSYQDTLIELLVPPQGAQGCTPGYWKQKQHSFAWIPTGYAQEDLYGIEFMVDDTKDLNLLQALKAGGGGENALYRHATAALLNAANPDVAYYYSASQVIQMVQDAYFYGDFEHYKDMLEYANELGCPLDNGKPDEPVKVVKRDKGRRK